MNTQTGIKREEIDMKNSHRATNQKGQSLVEFSVGMVLVLFLLGSLVDAGRGLFAYMAIRDAAQEGSAHGSLNPTATTSIEDRIFGSSTMLQGLQNPGESGTSPIDIQVNIIGAACTGNGVEVIVTYNDFPLTMPFVAIFLGSQSIDISATATDTILSPKCE
jgi:hypothetical protein